MPVFKRKGETTYSYRFQYRGRRFSGQTGLTNRRAAEEYERSERRRAEASIANGDAQLTFRVAASRYWNEHGQHLVNADDMFKRIAWLERNLGAGRLMVSITDSDVAHLVAKRRGEIWRGKLVSNGTVNRSVTNVLRSICNRVQHVWKLPAPDITWRNHILPERQEIIREASALEEEAILDAIAPDYAAVVSFAIVAGCRLAEIVDLTWHQVDWFNGLITVHGKGDRKRLIPITGSMKTILWEMRGHHPIAVFTYTARRTRDGRTRGERYPLTRSGIKTEWRRARARSGVEGLRFHDLRHTAATRLLRRTGNLRLAQKLLGHASVETTTRYAHSLTEDLRAGMEWTEAENGTRSGTEWRDVLPSHGNKRKSDG